MKKIIVRADDLGFSESVNYGIEKTVKQGIVKSVGVMINMDATLHGLNLIKDCDVCLGLHTNICVGKPLCDPKLIPSLVDENGYFKSSKVYRSAKEDFVVLDEVLLEIEAQYLKFVELVGEKPHYFEGHAVKSANFFKGMEMIARKYHCDYLPISFDGSITFRNTKLYVCMESMNSDYDPYMALQKAAIKEYDGICMFVAHPGYLDAYLMAHSSLLGNRVREVEMLCSDSIKKWLIEQDIVVISYDEVE